MPGCSGGFWRYDPHGAAAGSDLKTAVSEAVTNCIVHAYPDKVGPVTMTIAVYPDPGSADHGGGSGWASRIYTKPWNRLDHWKPGGTLRPGLCGDAELYGQGDGAVPPGARYKSGAGQASVPAESGRYILKRNEAEKAWYRIQHSAVPLLSRTWGLVHACAGRFRGRGIE